ncbi:UNVERIFIED_CONTAM: hypothetical protein K2H54_008320 [Gekko kuhli]
MFTPTQLGGAVVTHRQVKEEVLATSQPWVEKFKAALSDPDKVEIDKDGALIQKDDGCCLLKKDPGPSEWKPHPPVPPPLMIDREPQQEVEDIL